VIVSTNGEKKGKKREIEYQQDFCGEKKSGESEGLRKDFDSIKVLLL